MKGFYITGTDTGIGKTFASVALLHALRAPGLRAVGMKPVASGCGHVEGRWHNEDALALQAASDPQPRYDDVNPYALPAATAPEIAARLAGIEVQLSQIEMSYQRLQAQCDVAVVEGVGGWAAPLSSTLEQIDVVRMLELGVVLVVGLRLGCISHARLTTQAIVADGAPLIGWIANDLEPAMDHRDAYLGLLRQRIHAPCLGELRFAANAPAASAARLDITTLLHL